MKVFLFDKVSKDVSSFGALPRQAWMALGIVELVCALGLVAPVAFHWHPALTVVAATVLAIESLVFIGVHVKYRETMSIIIKTVPDTFFSCAGGGLDRGGEPQRGAVRMTRKPIDPGAGAGRIRVRIPAR